MTPKKFLNSYPATVELVSDAVQQLLDGTQLSDGNVLHCSNTFFDKDNVSSGQTPMLILFSGDTDRSAFQGWTDIVNYTFPAILVVDGIGESGGSLKVKKYVTDIARRVFAISTLPVTLDGTCLLKVVQPSDVSSTECVVSLANLRPLSMGKTRMLDAVGGTNRTTALLNFGCQFLSDNDPDYLLPGHTLSIVRSVQVDFKNAVNGIDPNVALPDDIVIQTAPWVSASITPTGSSPSQFFKFRTSMPIPTNGPSGPFSTNRVYTAPTLLPSDSLSSITVNMANRSNGDASIATAVTSSIALYTSDGAENPTGTSLGDRTLIMPPNGMFGSASFSNVVTGSDGKVVLLYNFPDPTFYNAINIDYGQYTDQSLVVDPPPSWVGLNPNPNFWIDLEYQTSKRRVVVFGDSISEGYNGGGHVGFSAAAWNQVMRAKDYAVDIMGIVQFGSYANYSLSGTYPHVWDRVTDIISGSSVVLQLGTNDLQYNDLPTMQTYFTNMLGSVKSLSPSKIYAWTVPPQAGYPGTDTVRAGWNTWLRANWVSMGLAGIYDAALGVSAGGLAMDSDPNTLDPSVDSGDQTHPSIAGQTVIKNGWIATIG